MATALPCPDGRDRPAAETQRVQRALPPEEMADGRDGVLREHTRAGIAHDLANLLALLEAVAVVGTLLAGGLGVHLATARSAQDGIGVDGLTRGTHRLAAAGALRARRGIVVAGAVKRHHLRDDAFFASTPSRDGRRISGGAARRGRGRYGGRRRVGGRRRGSDV